MSIIRKIHDLYPLKKMYVPAGWFIAKNDLIDAKFHLFNSLNDDDKFLIKNVFFSDNVFYAYSECTLNNGIKIKGIIYVGCVFQQENNHSSEFIVNCDNMSYEIDFYLCKGNSKKIFSSFNEIVVSKESMVNEINFLMHFFSSSITEVLNKNGFDINLKKQISIGRDLLNSLKLF